MPFDIYLPKEAMTLFRYIYKRYFIQKNYFSQLYPTLRTAILFTILLELSCKEKPNTLGLDAATQKLNTEVLKSKEYDNDSLVSLIELHTVESGNAKKYQLKTGGGITLVEDGSIIAGSLKLHNGSLQQAIEISKHQILPNQFPPNNIIPMLLASKLGPEATLDIQDVNPFMPGSMRLDSTATGGKMPSHKIIASLKVGDSTMPFQIPVLFINSKDSLVFIGTYPEVPMGGFSSNTPYLKFKLVSRLKK